MGPCLELIPEIARCLAQGGTEVNVRGKIFKYSQNEEVGQVAGACGEIVK